MSNRARIIVTLGGPWRLYQHTPLPGWAMLGIVQRGDEVIAGALGKSQTGQYAQINGGQVRSLDQRKVQAAIDAA